MASTIPLSPLSLPPSSSPPPECRRRSRQTEPSLLGSTNQLPRQTSSPPSLPRRLVPAPPTVSPATWVETLRSHSRSYCFREAISTYVSMTTAGVLPDHFAFPAVLKAAAGLRDRDAGGQLHAAVVKLGYDAWPATVANTLITMYARCGDLGSALKVFDRMLERDQVSWNSLIAALCMFEEWDSALDVFRWMLKEGVDPSSFTLVSVVLACSNLSRQDGLKLGKQVHAYGLRTGLYCEPKTFTYNSLMSMYAKLGRVRDSSVLFERFDNRDIVTWNTMISSLTQSSQFEEALILFQRMVQQSGVKPDGVTLSSVLPACSHLEKFELGKEIHAYALRNEGFFENSFVGSALVDMYCNCGQVWHGRQVFDGITERRLGIWNAMIAGYTQNELDEEALMLFVEMEIEAGLVPNATTIASILPACARSNSFPRKEDIHGYVVKRGFGCDKYVQNALMDMYARVQRVDISEKIFRSMEERDIVSWNTMIAGYVLNECYNDAFNLVGEMQRSGEASTVESGSYMFTSNKPNCITLITVLPACATLVALAKGREIHAYAIRHLVASDVAVGSAIVDMYAKCGCLSVSRKVFDQMVKRNIITWNVLIMAYGMHGEGEEALELFKNLATREKGVNGVKPNEVTFVSLFAACSHSGLVNEGLELFHRMKSDYGVEPTPDHYACVVDLLGRAGRLTEAYELICTMEPGRHQSGAWSSLLGACRLHRNLQLGEIAAKHLFQLESDVASHRVLLSNLYASAGCWAQAMEVRRGMKEMGVRKEPGCSWIEVGDEVHKFMVGDLLHPKNEQIQSYLEQLGEKMRKEGYVPDTSCVLHDVEEDEKEMLLCGHSEKLAIAFGILNTHPGSVIRVAKNLRMCNDCHIATKFISSIVEREIIVRDVRRFHHFKNGFCSCRDYW